MGNESWVIVRGGEGKDAAELLEQLTAAGVEAELAVCVRPDQADEARRIIEAGLADADPSPALDLETIAVFHGIDAEIEAAAVTGLLEQNGISVVSEGAYGLPSLPIEISVAGTLAAQAREIIARAKAEGPAAADAEATAN